MTNPFAGIITPQFKALFNNAIDALLEDTALTLPCRLTFGTTANTQCPNCNLDTIGGRSANTYRTNGPAPFVNGSICPMCGGEGFIPQDTSQTVYMAVLWNNSRAKFINTGIKLDIADAYVQTISPISTFPVLKEAKEVVFDTTIEGYQHTRFQKFGNPVPVGFGNSSYVITHWRMTG